MPTPYQLRPVQVPADYEALAALFALVSDEPYTAEALDLKLLSFRVARGVGAHTECLGYRPGRGNYRIIKQLQAM